MRADDKGRYSFSVDGQSIRANQGHSITIDLGLKPVEPPETLYHGTASKLVEVIQLEGIRPMKRHHVHLSPDEETATKVGRRHGKPIVLPVKAGDMHRAGTPFYRSENGVWLVDAVPATAIDWTDVRFEEKLSKEARLAPPSAK